MIRYVKVILIAFLTSVLLVHCSTIQKMIGVDTGSVKNLQLKNLHPSFEQFEDATEYNFISDSVEFVRLEKPSYDKIFKNTAMMYGTVLQLRHTVAAFKSEELTWSEDAEFLTSTIEFGVKQLPKIPERIKTMQSSIQELSPQSDFKGKEAAKAKNATLGINIAKSQLSSAGNNIKTLIADVKDIATEK